MAWQFSAAEILTAANLNAVTKPWNAVCQVTTSAGNTLVSGAIITVSWETEVLDPRGWITPTSSVITPNIAGYYRVTVRATVAIDASCTRFFIAVRKNAGDVHIFDMRPISAAGQASMFGAAPMIVMNGSSDTLSLRALQAGSATGTLGAVMDVELEYPT